MDRKKSLIEILVNQDSSDAEKDDAAIELGYIDDEEVIEILTSVAIDNNYDEMIRGSCGESLANIWLSKKEIDLEVLAKLDGISFIEAVSIIRKSRRDWFEDLKRLFPNRIKL